MTEPETGQGAEPRLRLNDFLPYRLSVLSNTISSAIAARYQSAFGLTIWQWRVMAVLGETPGLMASQVLKENEANPEVQEKEAHKEKEENQDNQELLEKEVARVQLDQADLKVQLGNGALLEKGEHEERLGSEDSLGNQVHTYNTITLTVKARQNFTI